jgi:adenylate cyclase
MADPHVDEAQDPVTEGARAMWRAYLTGELATFDRRMRIMQGTFKRLPANPRCKVCYAPFRGIGHPIVRLFGFGPGEISSMNPSLCDNCERFARKHNVGAEVELTLLFADIRGSTPLAERVGPSAFRGIVDRFYRVSTEILVRSDALIEKLIGDEVAGVYVPGIAGEDHPRRAVEAARELLEAMGYGGPDGPWLEVGVGVHTGTAYVGSVGSNETMSVITVLGDAANTTARLASAAASGEILVSEETCRLSGLDLSECEPRTLELKGRNEPANVRVLRVPQS